MFNGSGIIRTMGRSTLTQIIIFPDVYDAVHRGDSDDPSYGIHTLQTASQSSGSVGPLIVRSSEFALVNSRNTARRLTIVLRVSRQNLPTTSKAIGPGERHK